MILPFKFVSYVLKENYFFGDVIEVERAIKVYVIICWLLSFFNLPQLVVGRGGGTVISASCFLKIHELQSQKKRE